MELKPKSFDDVEIEAAATVPTNKEQIPERKVVCKACSYEFIISEIIKHNTQAHRGYCHCPNCQQVNDINKSLAFAYLEERKQKQELDEVNTLLATIGRGKE